MLPNQTPAFDASDNDTNCCPRFRPEPWQDQELHFDNKLFVVRASTVSAFHMPLNMGSVFARTIAAIETAHAAGGGLLVLSHDDSAWHAEHLFAVYKEVPGADMVAASERRFPHARVFEGPYKEAPTWAATMAVYVNERGKQPPTTLQILPYDVSKVRAALRQELRGGRGQGQPARVVNGRMKRSRLAGFTILVAWMLLDLLIHRIFLHPSTKPPRICGDHLIR